MTLLAATVAQALKARRHSGGWIAPCPAHNDRDPSLTIRDGRNGILLHCWAGCSFQSILDAIKALGVTDDPSSTPTLPPHRHEATGGRIGSIEAALRVWDNSGALCEVSRLYLERRGLLTAKGVRSLRSTRLRHPETKEENVPTLIVPRHDDAGHVVGVQRIFLDEADGTKYRDGLAKMSLGEQGVARLSAPSGGLIGLAEGPETALAASLLFGTPVWACCGGFPQRRVDWPAQRIVMIIDNDRPNKKNMNKSSMVKAQGFKEANPQIAIKAWMAPNVGEDAADVWCREMIEAAVPSSGLRKRGKD